MQDVAPTQFHEDFELSHFRVVVGPVPLLQSLFGLLVGLRIDLSGLARVACTAKNRIYTLRSAELIPRGDQILPLLLQGSVLYHFY